MTFKDYQKKALETATITYDNDLLQRSIWAFGIAGEAGEVVEKWKKLLAYKNGIVTDENLQELSKELGDVMWYIAVFADSLGLDLEAVINQNVQKLADRKQRDVIKGAGDNR